MPTAICGGRSLRAVLLGQTSGAGNRRVVKDPAKQTTRRCSTSSQSSAPQADRRIGRLRAKGGARRNATGPPKARKRLGRGSHSTRAKGSAPGRQGKTVSPANQATSAHSPLLRK